MQLVSLLTGYPVLAVCGDLPFTITGFTANSKHVKPGYLYICIRGEKQDGHCYVNEALRKGAQVIVAEKRLPVTIPVLLVANTRHFLSFFSDRYYRHPSRKLHLTGITGTNGKTTTAHFLYHIYSAAGKKAALMGTVGVKTGGRYQQQTLTTPGAEELHKTLWQLTREGVSHVAMEVSSHALHQRRVEHCRFDTAVFTNLTREHLDYHGSMEEYFQAKARLFTLLKKKSGSVSVLNADDMRGKTLETMISGSISTYGIRNQAHIQVREVLPLTSGGSYTRLSSPAGEFSFVVYLPGRYNVYNALAAAAAALSQGIPPAAVSAGIESLRSVPGRLEQLPAPPGIQIFLDYAHTPDGLDKVLHAVRQLARSKVILVFGCRSNRDRGKRPLMGSIAEQLADRIVLTADNPGHEDPYDIALEIAQNMQARPIIIPDREHAIHYALSLAEEGDVVLITGKGRETYQLVGETAMPYSDSAAVAGYYGTDIHL